MIAHRSRPPELAGLSPARFPERFGACSCRAEVGAEAAVVDGAAVAVGAVAGGGVTAVVGAVVGLETVGTVLDLALVVLPFSGNWLISCWGACPFGPAANADGTPLPMIAPDSTRSVPASAPVLCAITLSRD